MEAYCRRLDVLGLSGYLFYGGVGGRAGFTQWMKSYVHALIVFWWKGCCCLFIGFLSV